MSSHKGITQPWDAVQVAFHSVTHICSLPTTEFTESCFASTTTGVEAFSVGFHRNFRRSLSSCPVLMGRAVEHVLDSLIIDWRNWRLINTLHMVEEWERYKEEKVVRRVSSRKKRVLEFRWEFEKKQTLGEFYFFDFKRLTNSFSLSFSKE